MECTRYQTDGMRLIQVKPESYRNDAVVQLGLRIGATRLAQNGDKAALFQAYVDNPPVQ